MKVTQPLNGHVLIRPRKSAPAPSGIDIPESVDKEKATIGDVISCSGVNIGSTEKLGITTIEPGQVILFSSLSPRKVTHDGEECLLIHGEDVLAVIEG